MKAGSCYFRVFAHLSVFLLCSFGHPDLARANPYCRCQVQCIYPSGGFCLTASGTAGLTKSTWSADFDYKVNDGDPYGWYLRIPKDFMDDCASSSGYAQSGIKENAYRYCASLQDWSSYLASAGLGITVDLYSCVYDAK